MPKLSSVAHTPAQIAGKVMPLSDAVASLDALMERAAKLGGTDLAGFKKLKKSEQNQFIAQAQGEQRVGMPSDRERLDVHPRQVVRSPFNRNEFDPVKLQELRESVKEQGVLIPLLVRPWNPQTLVDKELARQAHERGERMFELVAGERRWTAASLENLERVPVIVRQLTDEEAIELQAIENLQREDLNALDEATKYQQLRELYTARGLKNEEAIARICERLGKSRAAVFDALRLLKLPEKTAALVRSGELPKSHAGIISQIKDPARAAQVSAAVVFNEAGKKRTEPLPFKQAKQLVDAELIRQRNLVVYEEKRAEFETKGWAILTPEESAKVVAFQPYNNTNYLRYDSAYVTPESNCELPGAHYERFGKLWGKHKPEPVLALAQNGEPFIVYGRMKAEAAVKAAGKLKEAKEDDRSAKVSVAEKEAESRRKVFETVLPMIVQKEEAGDTSADVWRWLAVSLLRFSWSDVVRKIARRRKMPKGRPAQDALQEAILKMTGAEARAVIVEAVLWRNEPNYQGHTADFARAAEVYAIDLEQLAASVQTSGLMKGKGRK